jgi:hypothetical protein
VKEPLLSDSQLDLAAVGSVRSIEADRGFALSSPGAHQTLGLDSSKNLKSYDVLP